VSDIEAVLTREMHLSERIVRDGHGMVPRFRVITPEGDFVILIPLPDEPIERERRMRLVAAFMALKLARAFVLSSELRTFDALCSFWVSKDKKIGLLHRITSRSPASFGKDEWLNDADAGDDVLSLLPGRETKLSEAMIRELERVFGEGGEFETIRA
jgi:hypothetical protein